MFIETIPNRGSPPAVLLREAYRDEHGRAQKRTLANLSNLPVDLIGGLKALLKGGTVIGSFRSMKTIDLEIRPIRHWTAQHVRAHVFLCMLAHHVEWHLREALAPL
ncbi:hypothetical protein [Bradyrhizobium sp. JR3.5]